MSGFPEAAAFRPGNQGGRNELNFNSRTTRSGLLGVPLNTTGGIPGPAGHGRSGLTPAALAMAAAPAAGGRKRTLTAAAAAPPPGGGGAASKRGKGGKSRKQHGGRRGGSRRSQKKTRKNRK